jgi:hypothetical protein
MNETSTAVRAVSCFLGAASNQVSVLPESLHLETGFTS